MLLLEKRDHVGGNCFDFYNDDGVLVHKYGPHYFRTDDESVFEYLSRFTRWRLCQYRIKTCVDGRLYPFPINRNTLNEFFQINLKTDNEASAFLESKRIKNDQPRNAEEKVISLVGTELYEKFYKNYTKKQWATDPKDLDPSVVTRIPVRFNTDDRYFDARIQAMPFNGYHILFENILRDIEIWTNVDFFKVKDSLDYTILVYTGCLDEYFNFIHGRLPYRSLRFEHESYDRMFYQNWVQINYPNDHDYTRIVEIKHVTGQTCPNTTIIKEYPSSKGLPFYPVPSQNNFNLHQKYWNLTKNLKNTYFLGRLALYKYLNMDQVIKEALSLASKINAVLS